MAAGRWSELKSVKFVGVYEKYECLWNSHCKEYKNNDARAIAIGKIINDMQGLGIKMKERDVKTRIKAIRTKYMCELRKVVKSQRSGSSIGEEYAPTCAWFKDTDRFLRKVVFFRSDFKHLVSKLMNCVCLKFT